MSGLSRAGIILTAVGAIAAIWWRASVWLEIMTDDSTDMSAFQAQQLNGQTLLEVVIILALYILVRDIARFSSSRE